MMNKQYLLLAPILTRVLVLAVTLGLSPAFAQPSNVILTEGTETVLRVPYDWSWSLETTLFLPQGKGPFPLIVLNHGKSLGDAHNQPRYRPLVPIREFLKMGYAVALPMRLGFSKSDGNYVQSGCNLELDGIRQSESIEAVVRFLKKQPYIQQEKIVLIGHSYGGFVSLAAVSKYPELALGVISFSGGLKKTTDGCLWSSSLTQAYSSFGKSTKVPSIWLYAEDDEIFSSYLTKRLYDSYSAGGANATLYFLNSTQVSGHGFFEDVYAVPYWLPKVKLFLNRLNLPS